MDALQATVEKACAKRNAARSKKNYAVADELRDMLTDMGVGIQDTSPTTSSWTWSKAAQLEGTSSEEEEEHLEIAQVRILRREGLVGLKTGITLAKAEAWRATLDTEERTASIFQGDGIKEKWYHLDRENTTRHWMQPKVAMPLKS